MIKQSNYFGQQVPQKDRMKMLVKVAEASHLLDHSWYNHEILCFSPYGPILGNQKFKDLLAFAKSLNIHCYISTNLKLYHEDATDIFFYVGPNDEHTIMIVDAIADYILGVLKSGWKSYYRKFAITDFDDMTKAITYEQITNRIRASNIGEYIP